MTASQGIGMGRVVQILTEIDLHELLDQKKSSHMEDIISQPSLVLSPILASFSMFHAEKLGMGLHGDKASNNHNLHILSFNCFTNLCKLHHGTCSYHRCMECHLLLLELVGNRQRYQNRGCPSGILRRPHQSLLWGIPHRQRQNHTCHLSLHNKRWPPHCMEVVK